MSATVFILSFVSLGCFALSVPRHCRHVFGRDLEKPIKLILRLGGVTLLAASFAACFVRWGAFAGTVTWFGTLTIAAVAVTLSLTYGPQPRWLHFSKEKSPQPQHPHARS